MARIVFYCNEEKSHLEIFEYYRQDVEALEALGHEVVVCTRYREIPWRFDAMFVWWWTYALWPVALSRLLGRPSLVTGVFNFRFPPTLEGRDYHQRPAWHRALISAATRLCSLNLFINETELRDCAAFFGLANARLYPCSVHEDYLRGPSASRRMALFNLAWNGKGNLIRKGIPELLQAVRILKEDGLDVRLFHGGPVGDGTEFLRGRIAELELAEQVTWLGPLSREDKLDLLRSCEIYVQPSHYEGFGLATAEAMGCGACVITCDVGAVRSVVGECGIYVTPGSPHDLAAAIRRALGDAALRGRLQAEAAQRARAVFAPEKKRERLRQYLAELGIS